MLDHDDLYIERFPGDLLTAEDWNDLQRGIKKDIASQVADAVKQLKSVVVDHATDADKLGGETIAQLTDDIVQKALSKIPKMTGYRMIFKRLEPCTLVNTNTVPVLDKMRVIKHELKASPLVDVYQLEYFRVLCATGDDKDDQNEAWVNFYLYHSNEKRIRVKDPALKPFDIEPIDQQPYKILFKDLLYLLKVEYKDTDNLDDLETDFWEAFFKYPNDEFEEDQFCHSPWFEKCCGEKRTVAELKQNGAWDDIWFQMRPRKTINFPVVDPTLPTLTNVDPAPTQVLVTHFDLDTLGIALLTKPDYTSLLTVIPDIDREDPKFSWLNVMMLLKV